MKVVEICSIETESLRYVFSSYFFHRSDDECTFSGLVSAMGGSFKEYGGRYILSFFARDDLNLRLYQGAVYLKEHEKARDPEIFTPLDVDMIMVILAQAVKSSYYIREGE